MRFDYGYDEEQRLGKPYDLKLLRRILPYAAPHRFKLAISVLLVVAITLLELSVPLYNQGNHRPAYSSTGPYHQPFRQF
jgi:hypothetical protein